VELVLALRAEGAGRDEQGEIRYRERHCREEDPLPSVLHDPVLRVPK
jgi:hypothetical protein